MKDSFRLRNAPVYGTILTILFTLGIVFLPCEPVGRLFSKDPQTAEMAGRVVVRLAGSGFLLYLMLNVGYRAFSFGPRLAVVLPLFVVAVNNLPIIALATGAARVEKTGLVWLFALECLSVSLFEETAFRGLVLPFMLKKCRGKRRQLLAVVLSSCLFGLLHLVNLGSGGVGPVLLQVGYSALIGAVGAVIVLYSRNLFAAVLFHAVYNFCGYLVPELGSGALWDVPTVVLTAVVGVLAAAYTVFLLLRTPKSHASLILNEHAENDAGDSALGGL